MSSSNKQIPTDTLYKLKQLSERYDLVRQKIKAYQNEQYQIKEYIENILLKYNTNAIKTNTFSIKRNIITQHRISKEDLPEKIFNEYSHPIQFAVINISSENKS